MYGEVRKRRMSRIKVDNTVTCTWKKSVDVLMEQFFPTTNISRGTRVVSDQSEKRFKWDKVKRAVGSMRLKKAPGLDGTCAEMLRAIWCAIPV